MIVTQNGWLRIDPEKAARARMRQELAQADVARGMGRLGCRGFSQPRISQIENEVGSACWVTPLQATALAAVLGVAVWDILAGDSRLAELTELTRELTGLTELAAKMLGILQHLDHDGVQPAAEEDAEEDVTEHVLMRRLMD